MEEGPVQTRPNAPPSSSEDGLFPVHVQQLDDRGRTDTRPTSKPSIQILRRASSTDKKEVREHPPDHGSSRDAQSDSQARDVEVFLLPEDVPEGEGVTDADGAGTVSMEA